MSLVLYKPNSKNTGAAFTFAIGSDKKSDEPTLFISAIAQYGWDPEKKIGSFSGHAQDPEKTANVKFSEYECGEVLSAFKNRHPYSTFHSFEDRSATIKFTPWDKPVKVSEYDPESKDFKESTIKVPAFGVSISRGKGHTFKIPLNAGEVEVLSEFLSFLLQKLFDVRTSRQRQAFLDRQKGSGDAKPQAKPQAQPSKNKKVEKVDGDDDEDVPF